MSQMNENEGGAAGAGGSNVVGTGAVDTNPTGKAAKLGDGIRERMVKSMADDVRAKASRVYAVTTKKK